MLPITDETKASFWAYSTVRTSKQITITVPNKNITIQNEDIKGETLQIIERLENSDTLRFEGCNATTFTCEVTDLTQNITGEYIVVKVTVNNTDIPLFKGFVDEVTNLNHEDMTCKITAYDRLKEINDKDITLWYNSLTFPVTLKYMRDSFFAYVGLTQAETILPNDTQTITKSITDKVINGATIIKGICQLNGRYGRINRNGVFEYIKLKPIVEGLYPADDLYPDDDVYPAEENSNELISRANYINIEYEPYKTARITKVNIYGKNGARTGTYGIADTNIFSIADNKIAHGLTNANATAQNLYNELWQIEFTPANIKLLGRPYLEIGDSVSLVTNKRMVRTYILQRTLSGIQAMTDLFESKSEQYQPEYKQSLETTVSTNTTNISNNATAISNEVTRATSVEATKATITQLNATNARVGTLEADHVSVSQLNATNARVGSLEADHVSVSQLNAVSARVGSLEADHVTTAQLNATNGRIDNLSAIAITTNNLSAQTIYGSQISGLTINASQITAGDISAGRISSSLSNGVNGVKMSGNQVTATAFQFSDGGAMTKQWMDSRASKGTYNVVNGKVTI